MDKHKDRGITQMNKQRCKEIIQMNKHRGKGIIQMTNIEIPQFLCLSIWIITLSFCLSSG
jgi:hypothetical protein